jgi:hypothetical protein
VFELASAVAGVVRLDASGHASGEQLSIFCGFVDILERAVHAEHGSAFREGPNAEEVANHAADLLTQLFRKCFSLPPAILCVNVFQRYVHQWPF